MVQRVDGRTQPAVDSEYPALDDRREAEVIEYLRAVPPNVGATVLAQALVVEAVDLGDLPTLVIAAYERDAVWISHLKREQ